MAKILYPVGTQVTIKGTGPFFVTAYHKGEKFPYRVSVVQGGKGASVNGKTKFSVKGLKRYSPTQAQTVQASPKTVSCKCYTTSEIDELLSAVMEDVHHMVYKAQASAQDDLNQVAGIIDKNFRRVGKQFKTLNHDDD